MPKIQKKTFAHIILFITAIIWGSTFIITKNIVHVFPPTLIVALRFSIAFAALCIVFFKYLKRMDVNHLLSGLFLGIAIFISYYTQTAALKHTTPGKNAFLTSIYCVIVPFLQWLIYKKRPNMRHISAAVICVVGIALVSFSAADNKLGIGFGDALSLISGFFYALHLVLLSHFAKERDPILLNIAQFAAGAAIAWILSLATEQFDISLVTTPAVLSILYLGVIASGLCLLLQTIGQKHTSANTAAIIVSLESVFGVLFSVLFYGEQLYPKIIVGFVCIFIAVVVSIYTPAHLRSNNKQKKDAL